MQSLILPLQNIRITQRIPAVKDKPFYLRHLENYLGTGYSPEMHEQVMDEVVEDVENRIRAVFS